MAGFPPPDAAGPLDHSASDSRFGVAASEPSRDRRLSAALETLTSGHKTEVRGGALQAHICCVTAEEDVSRVMQAFQAAQSFHGVANWGYAYRIQRPELPDLIEEAEESSEVMDMQPQADLSTYAERVEDGLDEGIGERILHVLRRFNLQGLLLVVTRWQDYGSPTSGIELLGTELYPLVVERCKDLITNLRNAVGMAPPAPAPREAVKAPPAPRSFEFAGLPSLPEPRAPQRYCPNHFMLDKQLPRPQSLPTLVAGGDVRLWMANDRCLSELPESELWALRSMRQPDSRVQEVVQAVALLRGQRVPASASTPAARWAHCREVLRSNTLRTELLLFDASQVPQDVARRVVQLLGRLDVAAVRRISPGAAALHEWAYGAAKWCLEGGPPVTPKQEALPVLLEPAPQRAARLRRNGSAILGDVRRSSASQFMPKSKSTKLFVAPSSLASVA